MSEGRVTCTVKTDCIIFDATALIQMLPVRYKMVKVISACIVATYFRTAALFISQMHIVFNMYKQNCLNTIACQNRGNTAMGHKMLLVQADMKVSKEWD